MFIIKICNQKVVEPASALVEVPLAAVLPPCEYLATSSGLCS